MKRIKSLILFCFFISKSFSQEIKNHDFIGTLQLENGILITYKLIFKELPDGKIEGFSITDFYGENNTKSKISGQIDHKDNKISFIESENVTTKSVSDITEFCFVHVKNAKIKLIKNKTIIQGVFKGKYLDNKNCTQGYLYLIGTEFLTQTNNAKLENKQTKDSTNKTLEKAKEALKKSNENHLYVNEMFRINWKSKEIIIEVWDAIKEDNDKISIFMDERKIIENLVIKKEKKIIVIPLQENSCMLKVLATNEGENPPNTVHFILRDEEGRTPIVTNLKKGESCSIKINRTR